VRGSQSSSSSSSAASSSSSSSSASSENFDSSSQFGAPNVNSPSRPSKEISPSRPSQDNSIQTVFLPIPESILREQLLILQANSGRKASGSQETITGSRRTPQSNSGIRRTQTTNRRQNNSRPRKTQAKSTRVTGNRAPDRRTQQTEINLTNSVDIDYDYVTLEEKIKQSQPVTIPPSKRDFTFRNGRIHLKSG
jgi:hypothetical protein